MGCTTLLMIGFSIKDTVTGLNPLQYDYITKYDLLAVTADEDDDKLISVFDEDPAIKDYLNVRISTIKVTNAQGDSESMQFDGRARRREAFGLCVHAGYRRSPRIAY